MENIKVKVNARLNIVIIFIFMFTINNTLVANATELNEQDEVVIPILMYHHFVEDSVEESAVNEVINIDLFERQLNYLNMKGFNTISLSQLRDYLLYNEPLPDNPIVITIDDGYESNYTLAYPILKRNNMKANINIIVSYRGRIPGKYKHFSWEQAKEMVDSGLIEIGSHTYNLHNENIRLKPIDTINDYYEKVYEDFKISKELITENLGIEPFIFCFPYGAYNDFSQYAASKLGFSIQLTTKYGAVTKNSDPLALERINVKGDQSPEDVYANIIRATNFNKNYRTSLY